MYAHELRPGDEYEPLEFVICNDFSQQFLYAIEDYNPVYVGVSGARPQLHPMILLHMTARTRSKSFRLPSHIGSVFAKEKVKFCHPAYVGDKLEVRWRIFDVYEKNSRIYQAISIQLTSEQGLVLDREMHSVFYTKAKDGTGQRAAA